MTLNSSTPPCSSIAQGVEEEEEAAATGVIQADNDTINIVKII